MKALYSMFTTLLAGIMHASPAIRPFGLGPLSFSSSLFSPGLAHQQVRGGNIWHASPSARSSWAGLSVKSSHLDPPSELQLVNQEIKAPLAISFLQNFSSPIN